MHILKSVNPSCLDPFVFVQNIVKCTAVYMWTDGHLDFHNGYQGRGSEMGVLSLKIYRHNIQSAYAGQDRVEVAGRDDHFAVVIN